MKYIIIAFMILGISSCTEKKNQEIKSGVEELKLDRGDSVTYVLPDGEKFELIVNTDGFDLLYQDSDNQFSINKSVKGLSTLASKLGSDRMEIADIDGDFYPDYKIDKTGTTGLSITEKKLKVEKGK